MRFYIAIAVAILIFGEANLQGQLIDSGTNRQKFKARLPIFTGQSAKVLDVLEDESRALISDGTSRVAVVDVRTQEILKWLPLEGVKEETVGKMSADGNFAWTLQPDVTPIISKEEIARVEKEIDEQDVPLGLKNLHEQSKEQWQSFARNAAGSSVTQWDLRTGEAIRSLGSRNRSILAFDVGGPASQNVVTLEAISGEGGYKFWLSVYQSADGRKVWESSLEIDLYRWGGYDLSYDNKNLGVLISSKSDFVFHQVKEGLPRLWSRSVDMETDRTIENAALSVSYCSLASGISGADRSKYRLSRINMNDGRVQSIASVTLNENVSVDEPVIFFDSTETIVGLSWTNDNGTVKTIVFDTNGKTRELKSKYRVARVLKSGQLLSAAGVHDSIGNLVSPFGEQSLTNSSVADLPTIDSKSIFLAESDVEILSFDFGTFSTTNKQTGKVKQLAQLDEIGKLANIDVNLVQNQRIVAAYSYKDDAYLIGVPIWKGLKEGQFEVLTQAARSFSEESTPSRATIETLGPDLFGCDWALVSLDANKNPSKTKLLHRFSDSPCIKISANRQTNAVIELTSKHASLKIVFNPGDSNEKTLTLVQNASSLEQISGLLSIGSEFAMLPDEINDDPEGDLEGAKMQIFVNELSAPANKLVFDSNNREFLVASAVSGLTGGGNFAMYAIDHNGTLLKNKMISMIPESMRQFMSLARSQGMPSEIAFGVALTSPIFCIDYDQSSQSFVVLGANTLQNGSPLEGIGMQGGFSQLHTTLSFYNLDSGKVVRFIKGEFLFTNSNPESLDFEIPNSIVIDPTGKFCSVRVGGERQTSIVSSLVSQKKLLKIMGESRHVFCSSGIVVDGKTALVDEVVRLGVKAFAENSLPEMAAKSKSTTTEASAGRGYFVGIGANRFSNKYFPELSFAESDIEAVSQIVSSNCGTDKLKFVPIMLTGEDKSVSNIEDALNELAYVATPDDLVVVSISTHGARLKRGLYLAVPSSDPSSMQATSLGWPEFARSIARLKAKRILVFIDACHAGSFSESSLEILKQVKADLSGKPGLTVFASSSARELSLELEEFKHGAFSQAILELLPGESLLNFDSQKFSQRLTQRVQVLTNGKQTPALIVNNPIAKGMDSKVATFSHGQKTEVGLLDLFNAGYQDDVKDYLESKELSKLSQIQIYALSLVQFCESDLVGIRQLTPYFSDSETELGVLERIMVKFLDGDEFAAIDEARAAVKKTRSSTAYSLLCLLLSYSREPNEEFVSVSKEFLRFHPNHVSAHANRGNALKNHSHEEAIQFLEKAVSQFPNAPILRNYLGHSQLWLGRLEASFETYREAISLAPNYANLYYMRGLVAKKQCNIGQFHKDIVTAALLQPNERHLKARIEVELKQKSFELAYDHAESLCDRFSNDSSIVVLAIAAAKANKSARAVEAARMIKDTKQRIATEQFLTAIEVQTTNERVDLLIAILNSGQLRNLIEIEMGEIPDQFFIARLTKDEAVRVGKENLGVVKEDTFFRILKEQDGWLFGEFLIDGQKRKGYVSANSSKRIDLHR